MAEKTPFVINDRRKFTSEGELRPGVELAPEKPAAEPDESSARLIDTPSPEAKAANEPIAFPAAPESAASASEPVKHAAAEPIAFPSTHGAEPDTAHAADEAEDDLSDENLPPAPSAEQSEQAARAYAATVDRLDTAIRAANPGMERIPEMSFDRFVQSLYMQAILQLGGAAEPGTTPQVDILGARQTIDMLTIVADKAKGNLSPSEDKLLQSALFEARMGFLEVTQALARQNAARQPGFPGGMGGLGGPGFPGGGPRVVR
ncbi:MAG TPA: DUF1844 domain-containing protein [Acidobacteriaceae bacterium]|jgi:hypothetical protein